MPSVTPGTEARTSSVVDLVLDLARAPDGGAEPVYRRRLEDGSEKRATFRWSPQVDEDIAAVQQAPMDPVAAARLGDALRAFLQPLAWWRDEERILGALEGKRPLRLRLRLDAAELHALPWELVPLGSTGRPLGSLPGCVIQYEWPDAEAPPAAATTPERVLFAWSDAGGRVFEENHLPALQGTSHEVMERVTIAALDERLRGGTFSILHLVCHGTTGEADGLVLHGSGGLDKEVIDGGRLCAVLAPHAGSLRLVVLCPAHGPSPGPLRRRTGSIAQALHRAGLPAVVAPRHPLAAEVPPELAGAFYEALLTASASTEEAFLAARDRLGSAPRQPGWASIQLYARAAPGVAPAVVPASPAPLPSAEPFAAVLEIVRAKESHDPYAFSWHEQTYVRRLEGGAVRDASFPWPQVKSDLQAMQGLVPDAAAASRLGAALRAFLDALEWDRDEEHLLRALAAGRGARVTFRFGAAELHALPWEIVQPGGSGAALGSLAGCVVHYEWPDTETARPDPDPPPEGGRILFAWSNGNDDVPWLDHQRALGAACREGRHGALDVLREASLAALAEKLRAAPVAVLHLLCHGGLIEHEAAYGVVLDSHDDETGCAVVDGRSLQRVLSEHLGSLRLVVLCACYGGNAGALDDHLGSVAQELHRAGVPTVVASRYPLDKEASSALTQELYRELLVGSVSLEEAFAKARGALGPAGAATLQLYARAADGADHRPIVRRPYRGLSAFQPEDRRLFFGRGAEIAEAVGDLESLVAKGLPRFLVVAGASGTGKSSLVLAGVVPALKERGWQVLPSIRPGADPAAALARARGALPAGGRCVLVVDQLEELFTHLDARSPEARQAREVFVRELWALASAPSPEVAVIASMRVDFIGRAGEIVLDPVSGTRFDKGVVYADAHHLLVAQMLPAQIREAIERPAALLGLSLQEGLADRMLADAGNEPGALPLLQFTLDTLWERRRGRALTQATYEALGGLAGAVSTKAGEVLASLGEDARRVARRLFVRLVSARDDAAVDTRRKVALDELRPGGADAALFDDVLRRFMEARLVVSDEGPAGEGGRATVEVAHEALIRSWGTLRGWVNEQRKMLIDFDTLRAWAGERRRDGGFLLQGSLLDRAKGMVAAYGEEIALDPSLAEARTLIEQSLAAAQREADEKEAQRQRELSLARRAQEMGLVGGARELVAQGQPWAALRVLAESKAPGLVRGWEQLARDTLAAPRLPRAVLCGHQGVISSAVFSPSGARVVTASQDGTVRVWNADGSGEPVVLDLHPSVPLFAAFVLDGQRVVTVCYDGSVQVWALGGQAPVVLRQRTEGGVGCAAIDVRGERVVLGCGDGTVEVWNVDGAGSPVVQQGSPDYVYAVAWSPDGARVVTGQYRAARIWSADGSSGPIVLIHDEIASHLAFCRDGARLVTGSNDGLVRLWNADGSGAPAIYGGINGDISSVTLYPDGQNVMITSDRQSVQTMCLDGGAVTREVSQGAPISCSAFSADGRWFVTASPDSAVRVFWTGGAGAQITSRAHHEPLLCAALGPDDRKVLSCSITGTIALWDTEGQGEPVVVGRESTVVSAVLSADERRIVTTAEHGVVRMWSVDGPGEPVAPRESKDKVKAGAWSPDGTRLAAIFEDGLARVWTVDGAPILLQGQDCQPLCIAFSPDGRRVVAGGADGLTRLWNADGSGAPLVLDGEAGTSIQLAAFSSDGRRLVTGRGDGVAVVWSTDDFGKRRVLKSDGTVSCAAFSHDGRLVAIGSYATVWIWDVDGEGEPVVLREHLQMVTAVSFSPDGQRLVTSSHDGTARLWTLSLPALQQQLRDATSVSLTPEQRRTYLGETEQEAQAAYLASERSYGRKLPS